jgi:serine/threonine protein kinase
MEAVGIGFFRVLLLMALLVAGAYVLIKLLGAVAWLIGAVLRGVGRCVAHVGRFVAGMLRDSLHLAGALIAVLFHLPALVTHVACGRWSAANHYGRAVEQELLTVGGCVYRLAIGHVAHLLRLTPLTDGVERRLPEVIARTPRSAPGVPRASSGPPDRFEGYRVVGSLQAGGSGARLWLAEPDAATRRRLAAGGRPAPERVVIKSFSLADGSTLPQIVRENRALEAARDLGLVLEHRLDGHRFHYVMPYVPGDDLGVVAARLHAQDGRDGLSDASLRRVLDHASDLLATLARFHGQGLWHKDVKPSNIIVSEGSVHLVDLGLMTPLTSAMTLTTHGTEYFRDPEMVRLALRGVKVHEVDGVKFDVYGAGATLYALVENSFPAHGSLSQTTRRCPEALRWVIRKAMADLSGRYVSARQMLADVRAVREASDPFRVRPAELPSFRDGTLDSAPDVDRWAKPRGRRPEPVHAYAAAAAGPDALRRAMRAARHPRRRFATAVLVAAGALFFLVHEGGGRQEAFSTGVERSVGPTGSRGDVGRIPALAGGSAPPLQVLPAVSLESHSVPAPGPGDEPLSPPLGSVLLIDDLPAGMDADVRARLETLCDDLRRARYEVVRDAGGEGASEEDIALLAEARVAVGLGDPEDPDAVTRLKGFLARCDDRLDGLVWIGGGRDGDGVTCLAIGRDDAVRERLDPLARRLERSGP